MATARRATKLTMMATTMATGGDDDNDNGQRRDGIRRRWRQHNGDSATGDEVDDDGDGTMSDDDDGDGATGDEVDDDGNGRRRRQQWRRRDGIRRQWR
jgi:hypothetical protein